MEPGQVDTDKGIAGLKKSDFKTPREFFGNDFEIAEMPENIRLYIRGKAVDLPGKTFVVDVYRLVDDGGLKNKKQWVFDLKNRRPEDRDIAERCGPGSYVWMGKWLGLDGRENGMISDVVEIGEEARSLHEAYKQKAAMREKGDTPPSQAAPASSPQSFGPMEILKVMEIAEEKTLARMERMAAIFNGQKVEQPVEILKSAYEGANKMITQAVGFTLDSAKKMNNKALEEMDPPEDDDEEDPIAKAPGQAGTGPAMPEWLAPFLPHFKTGLEKLLGGGPAGAAVKTLILTSDDFKQIFNDPEKWGQAVAALEMNFGSERTTKALDILLNRRKEKEAMKAKKKGGK